MAEKLKLSDPSCPRCGSNDVEIYDRKEIPIKSSSGGGTAVVGYKVKCQCRRCRDDFRTELLYGPGGAH